MAHIYALTDKKTGEVRYIGKANDVAARFREHLRDSAKRTTPLYRWLAKHGEPGLVIVESDCADWQEAERRHIAEARKSGVRLLNLADGGEQPYCPPEVRSENARKLNALLAGDPKARRLRYLKQRLREAYRLGHVAERTKEKLRRAAVTHPHVFAEWRDVR